MKSWEICISSQFFHRNVDRKNLQKIFLSSLICPLQMTYDNESLSLTLHAVNASFIHCPSKNLDLTANFSKNRQSQKLSKNIFSSLICPLKMTNDIEPLSLTLHGVNRHFIQWPPNGQNKTTNIMLHLRPTYGPKFFKAYAWEADTFLLLKNWHLTACGTTQGSDTQNFKIGHLDHPLAHLYTDTWWNKWMLGTLKWALNVSKIEPWDLMARRHFISVSQPEKKLAYLVALSSAYLSPNWIWGTLCTIILIYLIFWKHPFSEKYSNSPGAVKKE